MPPVPELVQISVGHHPEEHGQLPYSRMSFTFTRSFPSYHFDWVTQLVSDASGKVVPLAAIGYPSMTDFARAGDYEGVLTYGIGYTRAVLLSNPQTYVRAYEVEVVTAARQHRYVVAIDINAAQHN